MGVGIIAPPDAKHNVIRALKPGIAARGDKAAVPVKRFDVRVSPI
jgi:hypothetical protein